MKVVALVSGGKDSCYAMLLAQRQGHQVVALAHLAPADSAVDELDSHCFQSVGHQAVAGLAAATGLPLFRRRLTGTSRHQAMTYTPTEGDEVEDLAALLGAAQAALPRLQAVASGAIASDYQRLRVEHVCARLGLVSLAPLWHQPQAGLLGGMLAAGLRAVLVKVAALGLGPGHLGRDLGHLQPLLHRLARKFGCNVCGEGGEYETLTLDCPELFSAGRLVLDEVRPVSHSPGAIAPVAVLHIARWHVELKGGELSSEEAAQRVTHVPDDFQAPARPPAAASAAATAAAAAAWRAPVHLRHTSACIHAACQPGLAAAAAPAPGEAPASCVAATGAALYAALAAIESELQACGSSLAGALFVQLYLADMAAFGAANAAYTSWLPAASPAARACVQAEMPAGCPVAVDVLLPAEASSDRRVLHVQSISAWAPSCIGPYSQAVTWAGLALLSGQIGLDPASMQLVPGGAAAQAARCLASCEAVAVAQAARCLASCEAVAVAQRAHLRAGLLWATLYSAGQDEGEARAAALDLQLALETFLAGGAQGAHNEPASASAGEADSEDAEEPEPLPADEYLTAPAMPPRHWHPLATYAAVAALPRGAAVEVQPVVGVPGSGAEPCCGADDESDGDEAGAAGSSGARRGGGWMGRLQHSVQEQLLRARQGPESGVRGSGGAGDHGSAVCNSNTADAPSGAQWLLRSESLSSAGRLCRCNASLVLLPSPCPEAQAGPAADTAAAETAAGAASSGSGASPATAVAAAAEAARRSLAAQAAADALHSAVTATDLDWDDVVSLRVYMAQSVHAPALQKALQSALCGMCGAGGSSACRPVCVPVLSVGWDARLHAAAHVELLALRTA